MKMTRDLINFSKFTFKRTIMCEVILLIYYYPTSARQ